VVLCFAKLCLGIAVLDLAPGLEAFSQQRLQLDRISCFVRGAYVVLLAASLDNAARNCNLRYRNAIGVCVKINIVEMLKGLLLKLSV
jgi:hypothetical protein